MMARNELATAFLSVGTILVFVGLVGAFFIVLVTYFNGFMHYIRSLIIFATATPFGFVTLIVVFGVFFIALGMAIGFYDR